MIVLAEDYNGANVATNYPNATIVAMTAEAAQALEELATPFVPVCDITTTHAIAAMEEEYIQKMDAMLTQMGRIDDYYNIQYTMSAVQKRTCLYTAIIEKYHPDTIYAIRPQKDYEFLPFDQCIDILKSICKCDVLVIDIPNVTAPQITIPTMARVKSIARATRYKLAKTVYAPSIKLHNLNGIRITFAGYVGEDWNCCIAPLRTSGSTITNVTIPCGNITNWFNTTILETTDILCMSSAVYPNERQLISLCNEHHIITIVYQHGFGYNFQIQPKDEIYELDCPDYFLTYGPGNNQKRGFIKTKCIPVGSAKIQRDLQIIPQSNAGYILWVSESTTHNTHVASQSEDTARYYRQKRGLEILAQNHKVIYRPLIAELDTNGTARWAMGIPNITVDPYTPLPILISGADKVVLDITSPTTWGETIAREKPVVLFCDPLQTRVWDMVQADLERACNWCKTDSEFYGVLENIDSVAVKEFSVFVKKYLLCEGICSDNVCQFIEHITTPKQLPEGYAATWRKAAVGK